MAKQTYNIGYGEPVVFEIEDIDLSKYNSEIIVLSVYALGQMPSFVPVNLIDASNLNQYNLSLSDMIKSIPQDDNYRIPQQIRLNYGVRFDVAGENNNPRIPYRREALPASLAEFALENYREAFNGRRNRQFLDNGNLITDKAAFQMDYINTLRALSDIIPNPIVRINHIASLESGRLSAVSNVSINQATYYIGQVNGGYEGAQANDKAYLAALQDARTKAVDTDGIKQVTLPNGQTEVYHDLTMLNIQIAKVQSRMRLRAMANGGQVPLTGVQVQ